MEIWTQVCPNQWPVYIRLPSWSRKPQAMPCGKVPCQNLNEGYSQLPQEGCHSPRVPQPQQRLVGRPDECQAGSQETWVQASALFSSCYATSEYTTPWLSFPFCEARKEGINGSQNGAPDPRGHRTTSTYAHPALLSFAISNVPASYLASYFLNAC